MGTRSGVGEARLDWPHIGEAGDVCGAGAVGRQSLFALHFKNKFVSNFS